jgi:hypothetical protein
MRWHAHALARPGGGLGRVRAFGEAERIEPQGGAGLLHGLDLAQGRGRAGAGEDDLGTLDRGQRVGRRAGRQEALGAEIVGQAHGDAGAAGDQGEIPAGSAETAEVLVLEQVGDRVGAAFRAQGREALADGVGAAADHVEGHQADLAPGLALQHPDEIGIRHRRQRVVAHVGVGEQEVADEQVALEDAAPGLREGRAGDGEVGAERVHECVGHRADVALVGAVEG